MKVNEILQQLEEFGGFDNFQKWSEKQIKEYIKTNFNCSNYVAVKVAKELK